MNIKTVIRYVSFFVVSLVLLTSCGDNNSPQYQHSMDNNIGKIENSKNNRVMSNKINMTFRSKIVGLYIAYFNRVPSLDKLHLLEDRVVKFGNEKMLKELSKGIEKYSIFDSSHQDISDREFVKVIYKNILGKDGDIEGINQWTEYLESGKKRLDMLSNFIEVSLTVDLTPENFPALTLEELAIAQKRQNYIRNKVEVALEFITLLDTHTNIVNTKHPEDDPAYKASIKILKDVTEDRTSVLTAINFLNSIKNDDAPIKRINSTTPIGTVKKGYIVNPPLQGVNYFCDGKEELTDENGMFECVNPPITFKIGHLIFGELTAFTADRKVYLQDLLMLHRKDFSSPDLKLLARFIQSLDDDGDISKNIKIEQSVRDFFNTEQNFENFSERNVKTLFDDIGEYFVEECGAISHLGNSTVNCNSDGSYYVYTPTIDNNIGSMDNNIGSVDNNIGLMNH